MPAQAHREVPRAPLRLVASRSAAGRAQRAMQTADTVVWHRLADGRIWTHAPGQPCSLCDTEAPKEAPKVGRHAAPTRR